MLGIFMRMRGWIALIPLAFGAFAFLVGILIAGNAGRLAADGVDTTATITAMDWNTRRATMRTTTDYFVRYRFALDNGKLHHDQATVPRSFYETVAVGQQIPVRYVPGQPDLNEIVPAAVGDNSFYAKLTGGGFLLLGAAGAWLVGRRARTAVAVRDRGVRTQATVADIIRVPGSSHFRFHFTDQSGATQQAMCLPGRKKRFADIAIGDTVTIHYDPTAPKRRAFWDRDLGIGPSTLAQSVD